MTITNNRPQDMEPVTISERFLQTVERKAEAIALKYAVRNPEADPHATLFTDKFNEISYTWEQYSQNAQAFAKALIARNVTPGGRIVIQGANRPEWLFTNIGTILARGIAAGSYPNNSPEASRHVAIGSNAEVIVVENEQQLRKYQGLESTALKCFVVWDTVQDELKKSFTKPVFSWDEFIQSGESTHQDALKQRLDEQEPTEPCTLIYTSGTTGNPKAVVLTHDNLTWSNAVTAKEFKVLDEEQGLSYLPLSHIAAQQLDCINPVMHGSVINIAASDALKGSNLKEHIINTRPTYFLAIPRVWEKFKIGIEEKLSQASWIRRKLFHVATNVGRRVAKDYRENLPRRFILLRFIDWLAFKIFQRIVYTPLKSALGLDRCHTFASGAAPINPEVQNFFAGLSIRIIDMYGMSECSGLATTSAGLSVPPHSSGKALPGTELAIANPDEHGEGEILIKGRHLFKQYWNNPKATEAVFDKNGYLRTGDKGRLDANSNLFITGRYKELIVTSGGENIPPARIEQKIINELPILSQAIVIGDKRQYLTCLVTLETVVNDDGTPSDQLTDNVVTKLAAIGSLAKTLPEAAADPKVNEFLMEGIARANKKADSRAQRVQKVTLLPEPLVIGTTLTPTLKLRRAVIANQYKTLIDDMYTQTS